MIGTITWHFKDCVILPNDGELCPHPNYKELASLEQMLNLIKNLQHRPFVDPDYIIVEYHGYIFNVTDENNMQEFHDFLTHEALQLAEEWLVRKVKECYSEL